MMPSLPDKTTKYTVYGFLRESNALTIPEMISYLIMAYLTVIEYFDYDKCDGDVIKITDDNSTIVNIKSLQFGKSSIAFCHQLIKHNITSIWTFKINKLFRSSVLKFGVGSLNLDQHELDFVFRSDFYVVTGMKLENNDKTRMCNGDIVRLKLDLSKEDGTFICFVNDIEKMKYVNINKQLFNNCCLGVTCYSKGDSVTLIDYLELC